MIKIEIKEEQFGYLCKILAKHDRCPQSFGFKQNCDSNQDCEECWEKALLENVNSKEC